MGQIAVFLLELEEVAVASFGRHDAVIEQSGLAEEEGFNLEKMSRCLPMAMTGMCAAHSSKASALVPKPKLRARVMKKQRSQSPPVRSSHCPMRSVFSCSLSAVSALSQLWAVTVGTRGMMR